MYYQLNDDLSYIFTTLTSNNYQVFLVGGCVRDILLNKQPHDYDITTSATPGEIYDLFKDKRIKTEGINEGSLTIILHDEEYEITTFRIEDQYNDHRHPDKIEFTLDLKEDLKRRDFTINALAYNPKIGLVDLYNGQADIKNKIIRTIGKADKRFDEDALRILRALRFSAQLDFTIEENTSKAIFNNKKLLSFLSKERITEEFTRLLISNDCDKILVDYKEIFFELFSELKDEPTSRYNDACKKVAQCKKDLNLRLAIYFHNAKECLNKLSLTKKAQNEIEKLIDKQYDIVPLERIGLKKYIHDNSLDFTYQLIRYQYLLRYIDAIEQATYRDLLNEIEEKHLCYQLKDLAINGIDLLHLGFSNKEVGALLQQLLELIIEEKLDNDKESLLNFIKKSRDH